LNQEERQRALDKERAEAMRKINEAKAEEAKPKLPSFWLVSILMNPLAILSFLSSSYQMLFIAFPYSKH
jgi:hypothetical protein